MITILIVDDEPDVLALLRLIITMANDGLTVSGEGSDGLEAVAQCVADPPRVVVLDNRMPGLTGLEAAIQIRQNNPDQAIMLLSAYLEANDIARAAQLGIPVMSKRDILDVPDNLRLLVAAS